MAETVQLQIAALIENWQRELAERARDGDPYNEGYMDALDRCVQALKLLQAPEMRG